MATIVTKTPKANPPGKPSPPLPALPRQPLTPEQQAEALKRTQAQAEQRVKLGVELFKAAEKRLTTQSDVLRQVRDEQKHLREAVQQDVAKSLQSYDQWIGRIDEGFTTALRTLENKVDAMAREWSESQQRMDEMIRRSEELLTQSRAALDGDTPTERTAPTPLKFRPADDTEAETGSTKPASSTPAESSATAKTNADDEQLYSLILDKLRHDDEPSK